MGLPAARWLMDEFDVQTRPGQGTTVTLVKWHRRSAALPPTDPG